MPRIIESMEIELMCSDFRILRDLAESKEQSLDECVSDILEKYIGNLKTEINCASNSYDMDMHMDREELKKYSINLDELRTVLLRHGHNDLQFKLGETIKYAPSEIIQIVKHYLDTGEW